MTDKNTPLLPELLPCPHCGSAHITDRHVRDGRQMFCINCGASAVPAYYGPNNDTMERATAAWNRRAPSQDAETIKALREQIARKDAALKVALMWSDADWVGYETVTAALAGSAS
ncbi:Lar family restriction alleviation protein [Mesorhizobium sp. A556]